MGFFNELMQGVKDHLAMSTIRERLALAVEKLDMTSKKAQALEQKLKRARKENHRLRRKLSKSKEERMLPRSKDQSLPPRDSVSKLEIDVVEVREVLAEIGYDELQLKKRLRSIYANHYPIFTDDMGFFAIVYLDLNYSALVSLNLSTLSAHFIYEVPDTSQERDWEKLLVDHVNVLNSSCRRFEDQRLRKEAFKHYVRKLSRHFLRIKSFYSKRSSEEKWTNTFDGVRRDFESLGGELEFTSTSFGLTEQVLHRLHLLVLQAAPSEIPSETELGETQSVRE